MRYILVLFLLTVLVPNAYSQEAPVSKHRFSVSTGAGIMSGHTTFQIGGYYEEYDRNGKVISSGTVRFPYSELKFPLNLQFASLGANMALTDRVALGAEIKKNLLGPSGKLKDSDWSTWYNSEEFDGWPDPDSLDVYSESDVEADVLIADISARYYFKIIDLKKIEFSFFFGGKYIHQDLRFTAYNLDQWYPSLLLQYGLDLGHDYVSDKVLTYELKKKVPAALAGVKLASDSDFMLNVMFGYSPFVTIEDEDNHILRSLKTEAECDGDAFLVSLNGECMFRTRWSLGLKYDYFKIDTDGTEEQYTDGIHSASIQHRNFSETHEIQMALAYRF